MVEGPSTNDVKQGWVLGITYLNDVYSCSLSVCVCFLYFFTSVCPSVSLSVCLSFGLFLRRSLSVCQFLCLSACSFLSTYLSVRVSLGFWGIVVELVDLFWSSDLI